MVLLKMYSIIPFLKVYFILNYGVCVYRGAMPMEVRGAGVIGSYVLETGLGSSERAVQALNC